MIKSQLEMADFFIYQRNIEWEIWDIKTELLLW